MDRIERRYEKIIHACIECPNKGSVSVCRLMLEPGYNTEWGVCRGIPDVYSIPDWCPLPSLDQR